MSTVPQGYREVPAAEVKPGDYLADFRMPALVEHVLPYRDSDGRERVAVTATRPGEAPVHKHWFDYEVVRLATDAEIQAAKLAPRSALFDLVRAGIDAGLPIPDSISMPSNNSVFKLHFGDDSPLMVDAWAAHLGMPDATRVGHVVKGAGFRDFEPYESESHDYPGLPGWLVEIDTYMTVDREPVEQSSAGASSPLAAGAAGGTGPAAPSGPGAEATPGPDTNEDERPAEPGEVCTCGQPAVKVFLGGEWGAEGYCGTTGVSSSPCPWCGAPDPHVGRCPQYKLRPDTKTAAEGDDSTTSADAASKTGSKGPVDGAAAAPVAPLGVGATGVTPDPHAGCGFNGGKQVTCDRCGKTYVCTPSSDYYCAAEGDHCCESCLLAGIGVAEVHVIDAGPADRAGADATPFTFDAEHGVRVLDTAHRPSYDPQPTCIFSSPGGRLDFHQRYAAALDKSNPGWHWHDTDRMSVELAAQANERRQADTAERPYQCEGCGKTSRITPHEPGCPVDAAWLARNAQNGSGQ